MTKLLRGLSLACCLLALAAIATLLLSDSILGIFLNSTHQQAGALSLMLIGASYVSLQLSAKRPRSQMLKGVLLGLAFFLWGCKQLLPPNALVTAMDTAVVTIFVVDLSLIILEHLRRRDNETP